MYNNEDMNLKLENLKFEDDYLLVEPNYDTWEESVEFVNEYENNTFTYITTKRHDSVSSSGLTLEQTKELIEFLQDKVDMMEEI